MAAIQGGGQSDVGVGGVRGVLGKGWTGGESSSARLRRSKLGGRQRQALHVARGFLGGCGDSGGEGVSWDAQRLMACAGECSLPRKQREGSQGW